MATYSLTLRQSKGSLLTIEEMDGNFQYLNNKTSGVISGSPSQITYFDQDGNLTSDNFLTKTSSLTSINFEDLESLSSIGVGSFTSDYGGSPLVSSTGSFMEYSGTFSGNNISNLLLVGDIGFLSATTSTIPGIAVQYTNLTSGNLSKIVLQEGEINLSSFDILPNPTASTLSLTKESFYLEHKGFDNSGFKSFDNTIDNTTTVGWFINNNQFKFPRSVSHTASILMSNDQGDLYFGKSLYDNSSNIVLDWQNGVNMTGPITINNVEYTFPSTQSSTASVLVNDGIGNLSWTNLNTISPPVEYLEYVALMNHTVPHGGSSTAAPVPTILKNTLGNIVWSYNGPGAYSGTLNGAFPANKTFIFMGASDDNDEESIVALAFARRESDDNISVIVQRTGNGGSEDSALKNVSLLIRIYN